MVLHLVVLGFLISDGRTRTKDEKVLVAEVAIA